MPTGDIERMTADRRRLLVQTSAAEFAVAGYEQASLNRIVRACSMSKSSFYHVIASKQELFGLVVRDLGKELIARAEIPDPESFAGAEFWTRVESLFDRIAAVSIAEESFGSLGRMFYLSGTPGEQGNAVTESLAMIESWVGRVLLVGRESGAVRTDLPASLQAQLIFAVLRAMDEWTLAQIAELSEHELAGLVQGQLSTLKRMLAPDARQPHESSARSDS